MHTCVRHIPTYEYDVRLKWSQLEFLVQKWVFCLLLMTGIDYHYQIEQNLGSQECSLENFPRDSF